MKGNNSFKRRCLHAVVRAMLNGFRLSSAKFRYQPAPWKSARISSTRDCTDRLELVTSHLPSDSQSLLDIGSNAGFFLVNLARHGLHCHGIEQDPDLCIFTSLTAYLMDLPTVTCECTTFDQPYVQRAPTFDIVLNFSVMHHVCMAQGLPYATDLLTALSRLTRRAMFFEMGHSEENADWAARLPKMTPSPEVWIGRWLTDCGFSKVRCIGQSTTTKPRPIFVCSHD